MFSRILARVFILPITGRNIEDTARWRCLSKCKLFYPPMSLNSLLKTTDSFTRPYEIFFLYSAISYYWVKRSV